MKKSIIAATIALFALAAPLALNAQDFGAGLEGSWIGTSYTSTTPNGTATSDTASIRIFGAIGLNKSMDLEPYIGFISTKDNDPNNVSGSIGNTEQNGLQLGARLYFNLADSGIIRVQAGPDLYFSSLSPSSPVVHDKYSQFRIKLSAPLAIGIKAGKNLEFRLSQDIFAFDYQSLTTTDTILTVTYTETATNYELAFTKAFAPTLGVIVRL